MTIQMVAFDMAGTTVQDGGAVMSAFARAMDEIGIAEGTEERADATQYTLDTMGQSKIEVFRHITGSEARAHEANAAFEAAYLDVIRGGAARPIDKAEETIRFLRESGVRVALTTGFSPETRDALLASLGWQEVADVALTPADVGRGRPYPDMIVTAALRLGVTDLREIAAVGDTASDVLAGLRSGARISVGVLTGTHGQAEFAEAGATHVLDSVADLPALLG